MMLWPNKLSSSSIKEDEKLSQSLAVSFNTLCQTLAIEDDLQPYLSALYIPLSRWIDAQRKLKSTPLVVGINGAQGSGKSTLSLLLSHVLQHGFSLNVVTLSIDDFYKTRQQRQQMATDTHPLFITRGVPGTHDTALGIRIIQKIKSLRSGEKLFYPTFDKGNDERVAEQAWPSCEGKVDLVLFEGWCVGARPQKNDALFAPVNSLEENEDNEGVWRRAANEHLKTDYQSLFSLIECLLFLKIPSIETILTWRGLQERKLIEQKHHEPHLIKTGADLRRFIAHYERLTRFQLTEVAQRADLVFELGFDHQVKRIFQP